jgi:hypothetical protein
MVKANKSCTNLSYEDKVGEVHRYKLRLGEIFRFINVQRSIFS